MRFGPRELIVLVLIVAVPVASYFLVFKPQNERIRHSEAEIRHKLELLEKLRSETARTEDLRAENKRIEERIEDAEARLPTGKEVDNVIRQVSDLAVEEGMEPPAMKSNDPIQTVGYKEQPLEMETTGSFDGFRSFLKELELLKRITRMPKMKLKREGGINGNIEAEFVLSIYFLDEKGAQ